MPMKKHPAATITRPIITAAICPLLADCFLLRFQARRGPLAPMRIGLPARDSSSQGSVRNCLEFFLVVAPGFLHVLVDFLSLLSCHCRGSSNRANSSANQYTCECKHLILLAGFPPAYAFTRALKGSDLTLFQAGLEVFPVPGRRLNLR